MTRPSDATMAAARRLHDAHARSAEDRWNIARAWWPHASVDALTAVVRLSQMVDLPKLVPDEPTKISLAKITKIKDGRIKFTPAPTNNDNKQEADANGSLPSANEV